MAKLKKTGDHTEAALDFIFCLVNERELFQNVHQLILDNLGSGEASKAFDKTQFLATGYSMLSILLEHTERSQVQENEAEYMSLTFEMLKKTKLAPAAEEECLRAFNILLRILRPSTFAESWPELL